LASLNLESLGQRVQERLLAVYGAPLWKQPLRPLDELILTILSQNTNDHNRDKAYHSLRRLFPTWEGVRDAPKEAVIDALRIAGLANQKGPRIQEVLLQISRERGSLDLGFLHELSAEEAQTWLLRFKGVGPKTAAIVLQFSLGKPSFPVDTHIFRISGRLKLRPERMSAAETHVHLASVFHPEDYGAIHMNLIRLGREICHARRPDCQICPLADICPTGRTSMESSMKNL
jgi:endonuclease-3